MTDPAMPVSQKPVKLTPAQKRKQTLRAKKAAERPEKERARAQGRAPEKAAQEDSTVQATSATPTPTKAKREAAQLAQIVNLQIAGYSLADIGAAIGATPEEIEQRLTRDAARYVRTQPALRTYVRNWVSGKYTELLDTIWTEATDKQNPKHLEAQDRALKILERMSKLHGADAPAQTEIKVEAAPEAVERMVAALAAQQGYGYDENVFDNPFDAMAEVVDAEIVHEAAEASREVVAVSGNAVAEPSENPADDELRDEL